MSDIGKPLEWTAQQWNTVQQAIYEEARKARVAARFLPLYGPLPADAETVPAELLEPEAHEHGFERQRLHVNDEAVLRLTTIAVNVYLNSQQIAQPDLSAALTLFRRAANYIARVEDALIFRGRAGLELHIPNVYRVTGGIPEKGLYDYGRKVRLPLNTGSELLTAVARGITELEDQGYVGPYALALGNDLFVAAETPDRGSLVLPSDRIRPLIEGPMVRTGTLPAKSGILLSLAGKPAEIVVASEIAATFLQVSAEPRWIYRISERFVLRVKEPQSMLTLEHEGAQP
ncbi:MAG: encapsulin [Acidobacteriaceae bacterium]|nr:encapsulin [Acidobacteriaceae bacterium]